MIYENTWMNHKSISQGYKETLKSYILYDSFSMTIQNKQNQSTMDQWILQEL